MAGPVATRRSAILAGITAIAGCSTVDRGVSRAGPGASPDEETPVEGNPAVGAATQLGDLSLSSPAFADGGAIPRRFGRDGDNVNPPLRIDGVPDGAASLALVLDDPDAPGGTFLHWLVWNVDPAVREIPVGWSPAAAAVGENDFGNRRYDGPDPPDSPHTYRFKLFAVGSTLDLDPPGSVKRLGRAMAGALLGRTQLRGEYAP